MAQQFATGPGLRASCQHAAEKARASCQHEEVYEEGYEEEKEEKDNAKKCPSCLRASSDEVRSLLG
jgi:hypothetical protein